MVNPAKSENIIDVMLALRFKIFKNQATCVILDTTHSCVDVSYTVFPDMPWSVTQVLAMWEDTFTGVFKFRARWLIQASDLPADSLPQLRASRQVSAGDHSATGRTASSDKDQHEADEVFLTDRVKDLEVRAIVKPITLCVSTTATTDLSPGRKGKMGPRLTHKFCDKSGEFRLLEGTDPILKRARVRQANAVALASRADQENEAAKSGKPIAKSNGWLLPKRGVFHRRSGRDGVRGAEREVEIVASSSKSTGRPPSSPTMDIDVSDDSGTEEPPNSEDGEWNEGEEGEDDDATDSDSPRNSNTTLSVSEGFKPRKSARQRQSQRSRQLDASPVSRATPCPDADVEDPPKIKTETCSDEQMEDYSDAPGGKCSDIQLKDCADSQVKNSSSAQVEDCPEAQAGDSSEETVCPPPRSSAPTFQRRRRVSSNKRRGPLPPRSRRLAMPPMAEEPLRSDVCEAPVVVNAKLSAAGKAARPVRTRMSMGLRPKSTPALPRSSSMEDVGKAPPQLETATKRKRSGAAKTTQGAPRSDYPPLRTPVGKEYQADIPDLLSAEERRRPHTGVSAKMVGHDTTHGSLLCDSPCPSSIPCAGSRIIVVVKLIKDAMFSEAAGHEFSRAENRPIHRRCYWPSVTPTASLCFHVPSHTPRFERGNFSIPHEHKLHQAYLQRDLVTTLGLAKRPRLGPAIPWHVGEIPSRRQGGGRGEADPPWRCCSRASRWKQRQQWRR